MGCFVSSDENLGESYPILCIGGPSGAGKDTVMNKVLERFEGKLKKVAQHTTRARRPTEVEGFNYYYVSEDEFLKMDKNGEMLEYIKWGDYYYGLAKSTYERESKCGKVIYLVIGVDDFKQLKAKNIPIKTIAILPPSEEAIAERLKGRGTEDEESIKVRIKVNQEEMRLLKEFGCDAEIINDNLDKAVDDMCEKLKEFYPCLK